MTGQPSIESTLQKVQSGELSPADAAAFLLRHGFSGTPDWATLSERAGVTGGQESDPERRETLASLIARLGPPPEEVTEAFCRQAVAIDHEIRLPAGPIDLHCWSLSSDGCLHYEGEDASGTPRPMSSEMGSSVGTGLASLRHSFQSAMLTQPALPSSRCSSSSLSPPPAIRSVQSNFSPSVSQTHGVVKDKRRTIGLTLLASATILLTVVAMFAIRSQLNFTRNNIDSGETLTENQPAAAVDSSQVRIGNEIGRKPGKTLPAGELQMLDSIPETTLDTQAESAAMEVSAMLSLEAWMPTLTHSSTVAVVPDERTPPTSKSTDGNAEIPASEGQAVSEVKNGDGTADAGQDFPPELPQQTRDSATSALQLPAVGDITSAAEFSIDPPRSLQLSFPIESPLAITSEQDGVWQIHDTRSQLTIASIAVTNGIGKFRWSSDAIASPVASSLAHGRLIDGDQRATYLRPLVESPPWRLRFDQPDVMPTWDLKHPIASRVSRLSLELKLPERIEQHWIQSIEPTDPRRTRGSVILREKGEEDVALALRFDVRCGRKLSCRLRVAARLEAEVAWQNVSRTTIDQFADQLTQRLMWTDQEAERLNRVYQLAGSSGRRWLRIKQDYNEREGEALKATKQRLLQLQKLMTWIESEGFVELGIQVLWPTHSQHILRMRSTANAG